MPQGAPTIRRLARVCLLVEDRYLAHAEPRGATAALRAAGHDVDLVVADRRVADLAAPAGADVVLARGRSSPLVSLLRAAEAVGVPVVNSATAISAVVDKAGMGAALAGAGVPVPHAWVGPVDVLAERAELPFPLVLEPVRGDNASGLVVVRSRAELAAARRPEPVALAQTFHRGDGVDLELYAVGERVWAVRRPSPVAADGRPRPVATAGDPLSVTPALAELARRCRRVFGLRVYGVDCTVARTGISSVRTTPFGTTALTSPARLCFIVEAKYENHVMPGAVVDVLRSWGHQVDVLRPNGMVADLWELLDPEKYDAFVLKTVSGGPGQSLLDAAGAAGITTVNDYRAIRLARDKAVAAVRARAAGIPFPKTWFASKSALLDQIPAEAYPLVLKPNNGSSCERIVRVASPEELAELALDDSGCLLAQPYLPNPGYDVKLYNTGEEVFATVKRSPLHPGAAVVEEQIEVTPQLRELALAVGRAFGLDIYGIDVIETAAGWVVLDVNDFPSFGKVPEAASRLARTVLRVTRRGATESAPAPRRSPYAPALEATA
jgi:ribosomal protein S6--L-glutamate ligase